MRSVGIGWNVDHDPETNSRVMLCVVREERNEAVKEGSSSNSPAREMSDFDVPKSVDG